MRAFVLTAPGECAVEEVPVPVPAPGEAVVDVERVGVCGTDVEFFTGEMAYLHQGHARFPMRLGHEWAGRSSAVGEGVDPAWVGRRVIGDTMLGCGHLPPLPRGPPARLRRTGRRSGSAVAGPARSPSGLPCRSRSLHALPDAVDEALGALVEPGGNACGRSTRPARARRPVLVLGPGHDRAAGGDVRPGGGCRGPPAGPVGRLAGLRPGLGFAHSWTEESLPELPLDAVIDASNAPHCPRSPSTWSSRPDGSSTSASPAAPA